LKPKTELNGLRLQGDDASGKKIHLPTAKTAAAQPPLDHAIGRKAKRTAAINTLLLFRQRWPDAIARLDTKTRRPLKVGIAAVMLDAIAASDTIKSTAASS
jgi:hypothetical protein